MKKYLKKILAYLLLYLGITLLFSFLMLGTYMLPNYNIRGHVAESIPQIQKEGTGYIPFFNQTGAILDTHTDALILNIAQAKGIEKNQEVIQKAFENSFYEDASTNGVSSLVESINMPTNNHEYSRYWHGIQVIIRPLLLFFNYTEIRYIFMLVIFVLLGITFSMIGKQLGTRHGISFAITISFMYIILIPVSLQYSSIFIVTLLGMICVLTLYKIKKEKFLGMLFFTIGAFATFFDLLTYPLISLGIPLVLAIILENRKGKNLLQQMIFIMQLGVLWGLGYATLFFTKWIIASIVLNKDAVTLALNELLFRVNGDEIHPVNRMETLKNNFDYFFVPTAKYILTLIFTIWIVAFILYRKKFKECKLVFPLFCIAIVPYIWYLTFSGHSSIHAWFTNKIQAVTLFAILCLLFETIDNTKIGTYINKINIKKNKRKIKEKE